MRTLTRAAVLTTRSHLVNIFALSTTLSTTIRCYRLAFVWVNKSHFLIHWPSLVSGPSFFTFHASPFIKSCRTFVLLFSFWGFFQLYFSMSYVTFPFFGHLCRLCLVNFGRLIVLLFYVAVSSSPPETLQLPGTFPLLKSGECHDNVMDNCTLLTKFRWSIDDNQSQCQPITFQHAGLKKKVDERIRRTNRPRTCCTN